MYLSPTQTLSEIKSESLVRRRKWEKMNRYSILETITLTSNICLEVNCMNILFSIHHLQGERDRVIKIVISALSNELTQMNFYT